MKQLHDLMIDILCNGQVRDTRSGKVRSVFRREFTHDMRKGLPLPMTKKLAWEPMMGELLWFLNGETDLPSLRHYSCLSKDAWTIWTNDCERWHSRGSPRLDSEGEEVPKDDLGKLYGHQWRRFGETAEEVGVDQLANLVKNMKSSPTSRYLIVQAYNPYDIYWDDMVLPPCHTGFQVYVDIETREFDLNWTQRSVDVALGLPFNIASYAMLMAILGELTGLKPRYLYGDLKDTHLYEAHLPGIYEQLIREPRECTAKLNMPGIDSLSQLKYMTADNFRLTGYDPDPAIKMPLLVG